MALTTERIVEAACSILDAYGLADLTMRRVADELGVKAGALYWHFPNKQTLLAAVADEVLSTANASASSDAESLVTWATDVRTRLLAHRDAAELVSSTRAMGLGSVDPAARARVMLCAAGFKGDEADGLAQAFMHFILGHVMEEQTQAQLATLSVIENFDEARSDRHFGWGVELLLGGVEARIGSEACRVE